MTAEPAPCCPELYYPEPSPDARALRCDAVIIGIGVDERKTCEDAALERLGATAGLGDRGGVSQEEHDRYQRTLLGALGELAVARALRWPFDPTPFGLDVGPYNVRTRGQRDYELIIQDHDVAHHPATPYVLVTAIDPDWGTFIVRGWLTPAEADGRDDWRHDYGDRGRPAYFVPQPELHDLRRLERGT